MRGTSKLWQHDLSPELLQFWKGSCHMVWLVAHPFHPELMWDLHTDNKITPWQLCYLELCEHLPIMAVIPFEPENILMDFQIELIILFG